MSTLAAHLFREVRPDFFRVLAGPLARLYVDTLDSLEREASQRNQGLDRAEALALVEQVVEQHGDLAGTDDELIAAATSNRERARAVLDPLRSLTINSPSGLASLVTRNSSIPVCPRNFRKRNVRSKASPPTLTI